MLWDCLETGRTHPLRKVHTFESNWAVLVYLRSRGIRKENVACFQRKAHILVDQMVRIQEVLQFRLAHKAHYFHACSGGADQSMLINVVQTV
jgi:hypothetical protein